MKTNTVINNADVISSTILMQTGKLEQNELSDTIKKAFIFLQKNRHRLSGNGSYFIDSLQKYYKRNKTLSARQLKSLFEIKDNLC